MSIVIRVHGWPLFRFRWTRDIARLQVDEAVLAGGMNYLINEVDRLSGRTPREDPRSFEELLAEIQRRMERQARIQQSGLKRVK